ncbi:MAG TPA: hypothetical protein VH598_10520 [Verrucomicrobiae bacterium]|nr:hypothetical protein [Verrucomicrobiae bacterium]
MYEVVKRNQRTLEELAIGPQPIKGQEEAAQIADMLNSKRSPAEIESHESWYVRPSSTKPAVEKRNQGGKNKLRPRQR